jgi:RNA polymerase sigma-70 factor (ECF subfamily)
MSGAFGQGGRNHGRIHLVSPLAQVQPSDAELVRAVRERAALAASRVWERYAGLCRGILRRALGPSSDVEDALQEVFLRLFRDIDRLRDPDALRSFLIGITLHVGTSELRRRRARRWLLLSEPLALSEQASPLAVQCPEQREALSRLYQVLDKLSAPRRMVFVLRFIEGLELLELSAVLGCSLATTKRRVADAAQRVHRLAEGDPALSPYLSGEP